ncbi:MAG: tripartite tricarboxylate transporter substrate binding protein [Proteobacteria bacterium]|nr:tripartite tricarboxylate transporter substrate binding protein [Pseudomonadota bacterium]
MAFPLSAADYPSKPITMIVPYAAGGSGDLTTRLTADLLKDILKVNVQVENVTGGGATIGISQVARSKPDGYTLALVTTSPITVSPLVSKVPYDPLKDLTYVARVIVLPHPFIVRSNSAFKSLADVFDYARKNPGKFRWSAAAARGGPHLSTEMMFKTEGVGTTYVPFSGGTEAVAALLGGQIDAAVVTDFAGPLAAGEVRVLAESGPVRIASLPEVRTYKELGYPLSPSIFLGFAGPAGLPPEVVKTLDGAIAKALEHKRFVELAERLKMARAFAGGTEFAALVKADIAGMKDALDKLGLGK